MTMMPIGVPKVAYRVPGAQQADWVDIYNRLYRERIIFLAQEVRRGDVSASPRLCCAVCARASFEMVPASYFV